MPDPNRTYALQCNFCNKILTSGVTRMKFHLAGIKKYNAAPCQKVPQDVKEEMKVLLLKSNDAKDKKITEVEKLRSSVNIDHSEGEHESDEDSDNDVMILSTSGTSRSQALWTSSAR
uniref:BED-type domain-containing protein n=1 Tax=Hordeum vulgare subsp. vulgare TaxID=112509 RepID=A0A8I6YDB1_HORVV